VRSPEPSAPRELAGDHVVLRPLCVEDVPAVRAIAATPEVAAWWGPVADDFPLADEPEATRFVILVDGEIAGLIQFGEEPEPEYRHAWIDIFVDPARHGEGLGTDAVKTLVRYLVSERGHHRVTIDPAADNAAAIRSYEKAGFRRVGLMQAAWRDEWTGAWRDTMFMELVQLGS
jgi:aminoglycoside 6'-N-acetyltransferase